jgi:hypothetical protein
MVSNRLQALGHLSPGSDEQMDLACDIVERDRDLETVLAALRVLVDAAPLLPEAKPRLLKRYRHDHTNGPRRDAGGHVRAGVLEALRGTFSRDDLELLEDAVLTREEIRAVEVAGRLRARALLALDDVDDEIASYHAVPLLLDATATDPSNESALTAVGVLASRGRLRPIFLFAITGEGHPLVLSECLRRLTPLPEALVPSLIERHARASSPAVAVGLIDLLVGHEAWRAFRPAVADVLNTLPDRDAHAYAVTSIVASRRPELVEDVIALARAEQDRAKILNYVEALELRAFDAEIAEAAAALRQRLP